MKIFEMVKRDSTIRDPIHPEDALTMKSIKIHPFLLALHYQSCQPLCKVVLCERGRGGCKLYLRAHTEDKIKSYFITSLSVLSLLIVRKLIINKFLSSQSNTKSTDPTIPH